MQYKEIEDFFVDDSKLEEFLSQYTYAFEEIEKAKQALQDGTLDTPDAVNDLMLRLTGIYMSISFVAEIVKTTVDTKETTLYNQALLKSDPMVEKLNTSNLKKEIAEKTKNFRRVSSIFKAYCHSCDKALYSCQSSLKSLKREKFLTR